MGYDRDQVAERLADLRAEWGLSLDKLSRGIKEKTGVYISGPQLSKYENTHKTSRGEVVEITDIMNVVNAMALADFYSVSYDYILGHSNARHRENHGIASETSLSEGAIITLRKMQEAVEKGWRSAGDIEVISELLESERLITLILYIRNLKSFKGERGIKGRDYHLFLAVNEFQEILNSIAPFDRDAEPGPMNYSKIFDD